MGYERRVFLLTVLAGTGGYAFWKHSAPPPRSMPATVPIAGFDDHGNPTGVVEIATVQKPDSEWKRILPLDSYTVTRRQDTEMAFMGRFHNFDSDGLYRCICCATALFDSKTKYASGTGWPAFIVEPIAQENASWNLPAPHFRHGGHRSPLPPLATPIWAMCLTTARRPAGLRYCINSVALSFVPRMI